jgi:hypothetical protein
MSLRNRRQVFLGHFAGNCNITAAAAAAGIPLSTLYSWRRTEADFAAEWNEALTMGYQMLEARLIAHALAGGDGTALDAIPDTPIEPVNVDLALKLMGRQRYGTTQGFAGRPPKVVPRDEALRIFLKRLEQIEARKRANAATPRGVADAVPEAAARSSEEGGDAHE